MPKKNILNKNTSIIVKFYECSNDDIESVLDDLDLSGVRVSCLINRWAIEVPYWKEQYYTEKLKNIDLVETIHPSLSFISKRNKRDYDENELEGNENDN
jgi:hypothetical protein